MKFSTVISCLAVTMGLPFVAQAVDFDSFNDPSCNGFQEAYPLNPNSKGNLAGARKSFLITTAEAGCHIKFYTGLNQVPNDGTAISFTTANQNVCVGAGDGRPYESFGFYCP